ncbi:MAG: superoxide dismutase [Sandarakinorhabdus sp.]
MIATMNLPFAADALAPHVSAETFEYHHGKHFAAYVEKTNELIAGTDDAEADLETIIDNADEADNVALFDAAGQAWNHGFFWASLAPPSDARPSGGLAAAISRDFGDFDAMAAAFVETGMAEFGSGWVWLVSDADGALSICSSHDALPVWIEQPVMPLLVCDVWEHAYYIDWRNDRGAFLQAFVTSLANWRLAEAQFSAAIADDAGWEYPG